MQAGGPISWQSKLQDCITLSSIESEYIAACAATQESIWLSSLIEELNVNLTKEMEPRDEQERSMIKDKPYPELVGSLLWLSINTRPDISYAVSQVSRYTNDPGIKHWNAY